MVKSGKCNQMCLHTKHEPMVDRICFSPQVNSHETYALHALTEQCLIGKSNKQEFSEIST